MHKKNPQFGGETIDLMIIDEAQNVQPDKNYIKVPNRPDGSYVEEKTPEIIELPRDMTTAPKEIYPQYNRKTRRAIMSNLRFNETIGQKNVERTNARNKKRKSR